MTATHVHTLTTWIHTRHPRYNVQSLVITVPADPFWLREAQRYVRDRDGKVLYINAGPPVSPEAFDRVGRNRVLR